MFAVPCVLFRFVQILLRKREREREREMATYINRGLYVVKVVWVIVLCASSFMWCRWFVSGPGLV